MKRWLVAFIVWTVSTAVLVPVCLVAVFILDGPHGGLLPDQFDEVTLFAGYAIVLVCPMLIARWAWRRVR